MKKLLLIGFILVLSMSLLIGCSGGNTPEKNEAKKELPELIIKLSHNQPEISAEHAGAVVFQEKLKELSGGKITVEIFPSLQLGSMREQTEAVQMGSHEITIQPISVLTPFIDEFQVVDFPFLWPSSEIMWKVLDGEAGDKILSYGDAKGFKSIGFWGAGFKNFTTKGKEIHTPEDFVGVKMRVMPSPLLIAQYKQWGANPVPIEYSELYNSLQQRIVDGQENPIGTIAMNKFYEVQDNLVISNHGYLAYAFIANKGWFDGLPEEYKEMIIKAEKEAREVERKELENKEKEYLEEIKKSDINIYSLNDDEKAKFFEASKPVHSEFANSDSKKEILESIYKKVQELQ